MGGLWSGDRQRIDRALALPTHSCVIAAGMDQNTIATSAEQGGAGEGWFLPWTAPGTYTKPQLAESHKALACGLFSPSSVFLL